MDKNPLVRALIMAGALFAAAPPSFAAVTPELQRQVRASTFEVVMKKPAEGAVKYEKPLPLELLPYIERTDAYRSVGTAFALGRNTYVTAAHVLVAAVDSQYGAPQLRAADGHVHPIASIQKFSAYEDFVVFTLADELNAVALPTNRTPHVDDPVLAVGNALGEGIVIRDGLFTSETPEEQDGRWKWIRFSAAASPGNSGGPLLDAAGNLIGVVIAKSPNENLNYALPIGNVLDAPPSKARFDQRLLTKLPFAQGSKTYALKDEFASPLSWEKFVQAYQALLARHLEESRAALLSAYASSLFPRGSGTDDILYGPDASSREPALVTQQDDGNWAIRTSEFQFTDLSGDGRVGVAATAGGALFALHRSDAASDDAFYADSKAFMDVALKALNVRRAVGTDHVKVVSLGSASADEMRTDAYGRVWQLRVWPLPFLDVYIVAQVLPTPDGYVGMIAYAPSALLRETQAQLALLANQVTLTYQGSIAQWRAFLLRRRFLPKALQEVKLDSGDAGWTLRTPRFTMAMPAKLMKIDAHSELLMSMSYMYSGSQVVWDTGGVWWYRDAQEKAYVGLQRRPRPPASARLELRTRFDDLIGRHSPYDGVPVATSGDSFDVSVGLQAPGIREGTSSSAVAYALTMRLDGHPSPEQVGLNEQLAVQSAAILERAGGPDLPSSPPPMLAARADEALERVRQMAKSFDHGKDIRGRVFSQDVEDYLIAPTQQAYRTGSAGGESATQLQASLAERVHVLQNYWESAFGVVQERDLWPTFLAHNHLPSDTPHEAAVVSAETSFTTLVGKGGAPTEEWAASARSLEEAYGKELAQLEHKAAADTAHPPIYHPRQSPCPAPASGTSGRGTPKLRPVTTSLEEFYPPSFKRLGIEGMVILSVKVDSSGCPKEVAVAASSGYDEFDAAALKWIETAAYLPAEKAGKAVESVTPLVMAFKLRT
jgi:serine protease Do